jgi:hypothetical protein
VRLGGRRRKHALISPRARRTGALVVFLVVALLHVLAAFGLIGAKEPPWTLHLSFGALELSALDIWATTDVRVKEEEKQP